MREALQTETCPDISKVLAGFAEFQQQRRPRAQLLRQGASSLQALEALENPLLKFMALNIVGKISIDRLALRFAEMCSPGHILKYLPAPSRGGVVAPDQDLGVRPIKRPLRATVLWGVVMASILCLAALAAAYTSPENEMDVFSDYLQQVYSYMSTVAVNTLWTVESYRSGFFFGPMHR